ncbi:uncharacterized protein LOC132047205 isoform X1 [Lycium ferocissimum]|uniref:uncharacterized protein LOC132047205 isoform X1 n=1 Tax=Lycium ferocissimum TaxID=112874 RepID=UPI00281679D1|nr:uncharacterized protein LOC132047205 isoform X1 [Lycium ferocissimum]
MADEKFIGETENESPPEKKLKLEVDDNKDDLKGEDDTGSDLKGEDGEYDPYDFMGEDDTGSDLKGEDGEPINYDPYDWQTYPDKDVFIKYYQQLRESDGFDFDEYPGSCMFAPIYPILGFERHPEYVARIKGYASMAIKKYYRKRKDGKERKVKEIVRINAGGPSDFNFYITFKIDNAGKEETFQAKVVILIDDTIEIPICRRKKV